MSAAKNTPTLKALWTDYQQGQGSADHTARQVFNETLTPLLDQRDALVAALEVVRALPGFEPDEPYGQQVIAALKAARGES